MSVVRGQWSVDRILTRRNTFQKYFEQQELQQYIEDALETTAVPAGLGVFYVFRDPAEQQDFLAGRSRRAIDWTQISVRLGLGGPPADRWEALYAEHKELLDRRTPKEPGPPTTRLPLRHTEGQSRVFYADGPGFRWSCWGRVRCEPRRRQTLSRTGRTSPRPCSG